MSTQELLDNGFSEQTARTPAQIFGLEEDEVISIQYQGSTLSRESGDNKDSLIVTALSSTGKTQVYRLTEGVDEEGLFTIKKTDLFNLRVSG